MLGVVSRGLKHKGPLDGDGKEDVKKSNRFIMQNNNFARASRFFVHIFIVLAPLGRENA